jgi:hypothetical protein
MKKDAWLYAVAIIIGALAWAAVSALSGRREAWDSTMYFSVAVPVVCVTSAILGFIEPPKPSRWGIAPLIGQFAWVLVTQGPGNLLPLGVVVFGILSLPSILTAKLGAWIRGKMAAG